MKINEKEIYDEVRKIADKYSMTFSTLVSAAGGFEYICCEKDRSKNIYKVLFFMRGSFEKYKEIHDEIVNLFEANGFSSHEGNDYSQQNNMYKKELMFTENVPYTGEIW